MNRSELFRGFLATSLRDAPYAGLFVVFYEGIKRDFPFPDWAPAMVHSSSGAAAGALATLATHPFDVVKVRILGARKHRWANIVAQTKIQVRSDAQYQSFGKTVSTIWMVCTLSTPTHSSSHLHSKEAYRDISTVPPCALGEKC